MFCRGSAPLGPGSAPFKTSDTMARSLPRLRNSMRTLEEIWEKPKKKKKTRLPSAPSVLPSVRIINQAGLRGPGTHRAHRMFNVSRDGNHAGLRPSEEEEEEEGGGGGGRGVFVTVSRWKLCEMQCDGLKSHTSGSSLRSGAGFRALLCSTAGFRTRVANKVIFFFFFFFPGFQWQKKKKKKSPAKGTSAYVQTSYMRPDNKIYTSGDTSEVWRALTVCLRSERCTAEKGTEAFRGSNLLPQRSNCDICTSVFSCDALSLQLVPSHDYSPS